jgi:hypothetical protein
MNISRRGTLKKSLAILLGALVAVWITACALIYYKMRRPPEEFGRFMSKIPAPVVFMAFPFETLWLRARSGTLRVGDPAPDFTLLKTDKSEFLHLSEMTRRQPVVLIFGSYT